MALWADLREPVIAAVKAMSSVDKVSGITCSLSRIAVRTDSHSVQQCGSKPISVRMRVLTWCYGAPRKRRTPRGRSWVSSGAPARASGRRWCDRRCLPMRCVVLTSRMADSATHVLALTLHMLPPVHGSQGEGGRADRPAGIGGSIRSILRWVCCVNAGTERAYARVLGREVRGDRAAEHRGGGRERAGSLAPYASAVRLPVLRWHMPGHWMLDGQQHP